MLVKQQHQPTALFQMPHEPCRAAPPLRKHRSTEGFERFDVMRVEIRVLHLAVEPADVIAPRHEGRPRRFVIAVMPGHQDHWLAGAVGLLQRRHAGAAWLGIGHAFGEIIGRVILDERPPQIVETARGNFLATGERHLGPDMFKIVERTAAVARQRGQDMLYQAADKAEPRLIGQGQSRANDPDDQQIAQVMARPATEGIGLFDLGGLVRHGL